MKKTALLLALLLLGAVVAAGCIGSGDTATQTSTSPPSSTSPTKTPSSTPTTTSQTPSTTHTSVETEKSFYPVTIRDFANRTVIIKKKPERVVTLAPPAITEDLYYIGQFDEVVGVTDYDDFPPGVANLTRIGGYGKYAKLEVIASLKPDLILVDSYSTPIMESLEKIAPPVVVVDPPHGLNDIPKALELLGKVFNAEDDAKKAIAEFNARVDAVSSAVKDEPKLKVFYIVWSNPLMTAGGGGTFISDVIGLAGGGENIFKDASGWPTVSVEQVIERDPDVIILTPTAG